MSRKQLPDALLAQLQRKGHGDIVVNIAELRWELYQAAMRRDWNIYENKRQQLNLLGLDIPDRRI